MKTTAPYLNAAQSVDACWQPLLIIYFDQTSVVYEQDYPCFHSLNEALHYAYRARADVFCPPSWRIVPGVRSISHLPAALVG